MASKPSQQGPGKVSITCPHCSFQQMESASAHSTFCRKCQAHIDLRPKIVVETPKPSKLSLWVDQVSRFLRGEKILTITCFDCRAKQEISNLAKSTNCPHCGSYIDLSNVKIIDDFNRSFLTQGAIFVGPKGNVSSSRIGCREAEIRGKIQGNLFCTARATFKTKGKIVGSIESAEVLIEKRSDIEFVRPLRAGKVIIRGKMNGRIQADSVKILKSGRMDGTIHAKSIDIDRGGIFLGELFIGNKESSQSETGGSQKTANLPPVPLDAVAPRPLKKEGESELFKLDGGGSSSASTRRSGKGPRH